MDRPTPQDLYDRFRISEHALNGELSEEHLQEVSHFIDHNTLGPELGLTSQDMKDINLDERAEDLRRAATLRKWKEVYAFNATYRKLIEALLKCRKADQAVKVCELLTSAAEQPEAGIEPSLTTSPSSPQYGEQSSSDLLTPPYSPGNMTDGLPGQVVSSVEALQSTLNQEEDDVTVQKEKELVHLDDKFLGLLDASRDDLNENRITPKRIRQKLFVRRASDTKTNSSLVASFRHKIKKAETVDDIFEIFSAEQCWSALNSGVLERIINDHCSESVEVQKLKKDFLKEQQAFRRNTKLRQFAKISNDVTVGSAFSEIVMEMEEGWDGTLAEAEMIKCRMIRDNFAAEQLIFIRSRSSTLSLVWAFPRSCPVSTTVLRIPPAFYLENNIRRVLVKGVCIIDVKFEEEEQTIVAKPRDVTLQLQEKLQQKEGEAASLQDTVEVMTAAEATYKQKLKEMEERIKTARGVKEKAESQIHELNVALDRAKKNISDIEMQAAGIAGVSPDDLADLLGLQQEKKLKKKTATIAQLEKEMKREKESFRDQLAQLEENIRQLQAQRESPDKIDDSDKRGRSFSDIITMVKSEHREVILEKYEKSERDLLQELKRMKGVEGRKPTPPTGKEYVEYRGIRYSMKYGCAGGSTGETMILVSVGSEFQSDIQVKRRVRDPAMAEKAINRHGHLPTTPITLQEETSADLMAHASLELQDTAVDLVRLCLDVPGKQRSKQYYLQAIEEFFKNCQEPIVTLVYLGHSQKGTGNWCFKDGTISFREIFDLHRQTCPGKHLTIMPDCCYSGQWTIDCAKTLDSLGIPPCGHRAREQGVFIKVYASCRPDQKAAEPCYSIEAIKVSDDGTLTYYGNKKFNETQTSCGTDFTKLTCCRGPDESCRSEEVLKNWTWEEAIDSGLTSRVYILQGKDRGRPAWYMVLLSNKSEEYKERFVEQVKTGNMDFAKWGYICKSGWGEGPPDSVKDRIYAWVRL